MVPFLRQVGGAGGSPGEYKKQLCDGRVHRKFTNWVAEALDDRLWPVANVGDKFGLDLEEIAVARFKKVPD